jgi:hypothetical protein
MSALPNANVCCVCSQPALPDQADPRGRTELRPYGPKGAPICFACALKPENCDETQRQFDKALDAAEDASRADGARIAHVELTPHGPRGIKTGSA